MGLIDRSLQLVVDDEVHHAVRIERAESRRLKFDPVRYTPPLSSPSKTAVQLSFAMPPPLASIAAPRIPASPPSSLRTIRHFLSVDGNTLISKESRILSM